VDSKGAVFQSNAFPLNEGRGSIAFI
jgi:hypothetical protein